MCLQCQSKTGKLFGVQDFPSQSLIIIFMYKYNIKITVNNYMACVVVGFLFSILVICSGDVLCCSNLNLIGDVKSKDEHFGNWLNR